MKTIRNTTELAQHNRNKPQHNENNPQHNRISTTQQKQAKTK